MKPVYFFIVDGLMIDTGPSLATNRVLKIAKSHSIDNIVLTHAHEDHSGNAGSLSMHLQVPVLGHPLTAHIMEDGFDILPYQHLMFGKALKVNILPVGEKIITPNHTFETIHTPGHADEHIALYESQKGWLFSGDLYVAERIKFFRRGESLQTQIESLRKLVVLDFDVMFCSHNPQLTNGKQKLERKLANFEELYDSIIHHHRKGLGTDEIAEAIGLGKGWDIGLFTFGDVKPEYIITSVTKNLL